MRFSREITVFHARKAPKPAILVGYGALIEGFQLAVPLPEQLTLISSKKRQYITDQWMVFTSRHQPDDTLYKHIVFALKYKGIQLLIFKNYLRNFLSMRLLNSFNWNRWVNTAEEFGFYTNGCSRRSYL